MSATENKTVISDFIATVFNKHDLEALTSFVANERLLASATGLVRGNPDLVLNVQHMIAEDDLVAVRIAGSGTHTGPWRGLSPSGKSWQATCNAQYRLANGKIVDFWVNWDWLSIMQQLGAVTGP
jgi:predicted ester cyclase